MNTDTMKPNDEPVTVAGVVSSDFLGSVLRIEHGWLTIRTETGWLLWTKKCSDINDSKGEDFSDVVARATAAYAVWQSDPARKWEREQDVGLLPNVTVSQPTKHAKQSDGSSENCDT
jgi:hypothetical protein